MSKSLVSDMIYVKVNDVNEFTRVTVDAFCRPTSFYHHHYVTPTSLGNCHSLSKSLCSLCSLCLCTVNMILHPHFVKGVARSGNTRHASRIAGISNIELIISTIHLVISPILGIVDITN